MTRRMIGLSDSLHMELNDASKECGVPMTIMIGALLLVRDQVDWKAVKANYLDNKPTWKNIRKKIDEYRGRFPEADDKKLAELTGYSILQVEVVTYSAHKRCLEVLNKNPQAKPDAIQSAAKVSSKFALRIWQQFHGVTKIPQAEKFLWPEHV